MVSERLTFSYICVANKGNPAPNVDRHTVLAANAEAAAKRYTSMTETQEREREDVKVA